MVNERLVPMDYYLLQNSTTITRITIWSCERYRAMVMFTEGNSQPLILNRMKLMVCPAFAFGVHFPLAYTALRKHHHSIIINMLLINFLQTTIWRL